MMSPSFALRRIEKTHRLADWGFNVTVCIAAICNDHKTIVLASDSKVSFADFSSDMAVLKFETLFTHWLTLFAGEDTEHIPFILERAHELLLATLKRKSASPTPTQVANALQRAYDERLDAEITAKVLRRYNFTGKSFRDEGKRKCTASVYNSICTKIALVKLSLKFLIVGFDSKKEPRIMVGGGEETPMDYTRLGFWAIGSGADAALSSLMYHRQRQQISTMISVEQCVYVVAASKYMAESARDVGEHTSMMTLDMSPALNTIMDNPIRKIWKEEGAPRLPQNLESRIRPLIVTPEQARSKANEAIEYFTQSASRKSAGRQ